MEEKKEEKKVSSEPNKISYEQLEQAAMQLQQRLMIAENKLRSIDFASMRLTWLFKVLENKSSFSTEFAGKCAKEVEELLTIEDTPEETPESDKA